MAEKFNFQNSSRLAVIADGEDKLVQEVKSIVQSGRNLPGASEKGIKSEMVNDLINDFGLAGKMPITESVIVPFMRPVLYIKNGQIEIPKSNELKERLYKYKPNIELSLKSVGRIELLNHQLVYCGTGWLISEGIIVTNRHVAEEFSKRNTNGFGGQFRKNFAGIGIDAKIDFKEEHITASDSSSNQFEVEVEKIVYLLDDKPSNPDLALLKIRKIPGLPDPIPFITDVPVRDQNIGVVGYPAKDPRGVTDEAMEKRIFEEVFGVKRYAPGQVLGVENHTWYFTHDASTLGGNSGSLVQDMETGAAIGLHFSGVLLQANYAVKGQEILNAASRAGVTGVKVFAKKDAAKIIVSHDPIEEKVYDISEYDNRAGFNTEFLGETICLPEVKDKKDILKFGKNNKEQVLNYTHFSVSMSKSRRLCFYSAVNIDGQSYKRIKRTGWRFDSRIPREAQIMDECYGNRPKFSRGHMTRREDPNWGEDAVQGNSDSMHVTNTVPQVQSFNAGTWLELENYALENAKSDEQKICVFTGPYFKDTDPEFDGVKVPVKFWKVIAFIHDDTKKLCATGYVQSQEDFFQRTEFVYGEFNTFQVPIRTIEKEAGISFGNLSGLDPLVENFYESMPVPIKSVRQIKFY